MNALTAYIIVKYLITIFWYIGCFYPWHFKAPHCQDEAPY